jgi:hypothetical protein
LRANLPRSASIREDGFDYALTPSNDDRLGGFVDVVDDGASPTDVHRVDLKVRTCEQRSVRERAEVGPGRAGSCLRRWPVQSGPPRTRHYSAPLAFASLTR